MCIWDKLTNKIKNCRALRALGRCEKTPLFAVLNAVARMKFLFVFMGLQLLSCSSFGLEQKDRLSGEELFDRADSVAIIRLTGGDYVVGIGDGYELRGEVLTILKGELEKNISYFDGYDYSEPCFKRSLGSFYIIYLKGQHTLWATASSFEIEGSPKFWFGHDTSDEEISMRIAKEFSKEAFFGSSHVWYAKECPGAQTYNQLMTSALRSAFNKSNQPTANASTD